jgi:dipeptidyl aminopeptidase/acylaminoacyl peptidase
LPSSSETPSPTVAPTPAAFTIDEGIVQVLTDHLVLRAGPAHDTPTLAQLSMGQVVWATGRAEGFDGTDWIEISQAPSRRVGWVEAATEGVPSLAIVRDGPIGLTSGADVELMDLTTGQSTPVTSGMTIHELAFAPDGEHVAVFDPFRGKQVVALDTVTRPAPTPEPSGPVYGPPALLDPGFAPNGEAVSYLEGQDFLGLQLLWLGAGAAPTFATPPTWYPVSWAPDSRRIASAQMVNASFGPRENWEIVVARQGRAEPVRLTTRAGLDISPAWSPDGSTIAYLQVVDRGTMALALMDADGSNQRTLLTFDGSSATVPQPAWSPDGTRVAIAQFLDGLSAVIHLVDAQTAEHHSIPAPAPQCSDLTWSPSGSQIAYVCMNDVTTNAYVTPAQGTNVISLGPAWHLDWARTLEPLVPQGVAGE